MTKQFSTEVLTVRTPFFQPGTWNLWVADIVLSKSQVMEQKGNPGMWLLYQLRVCRLCGNYAKLDFGAKKWKWAAVTETPFW